MRTNGPNQADRYNVHGTSHEIVIADIASETSHTLKNENK